MRRRRLRLWGALPIACILLAILWVLGCSSTEEPTPNPPTPPPPSGDALTVHYYRPLSDYTGYQLSASGDTTAAPATPLDTAGTDAFGVTFSVPLRESAAQVSFTIKKGDAPDPASEIAVNLAELGKEVWVYSGSPRAYTAAPAIPEKDTAIIYYKRVDDAYEGWGLYAWDDITDTPTWNEPIKPAGTDTFGTYFVVHLKPDAKKVSFIIHNGDTKDPGPDQILDIPTQGSRIWVVSADTAIYTYPAEAALIDAVRAHWVSKDTIAWNLVGDDATLGASTYALHIAPEGGMTAGPEGIEGGESIALTYDKAGLSDAVKAKFPHLAAYKALRIAAADAGKVAGALKGQLLVSASKPDGALMTSTGVQIPGVLDELYAYAGDLGVTFTAGAPTLRVWAPTARSVKLHIYNNPTVETASKVVAMTESGGVFTAVGDAAWKGKYYLYEVEVFVPSTGKVEHNMVTDPYSVSLSANSLRSQVVDLADPSLEPAGWAALAKPALESPSDVSIYELHVRDFSITDPTVTAPDRGTFMAFTESNSNGMTHLKGLAAAGLTHLHLLPVFDFATVNENKAEQQGPGDLGGLPPDSAEQQAAIAKVRDADGFNWGYDPYHYTAPEGSYATNPNGSARVLEFRSMVKGINEAGLRVVMDVVYNHTTKSGQDPKSVLDRIVPGYYHRLSDKGAVETSTCCQNTATEHVMMEKLMIDSLVTWARAYKVDGFRFDLMGHHMKQNMLNVRAALDALTLDKDGVDGSKIYIYGEGWDFGEVANNARGVNATQKNMAGTGIGTFNDRLRDAVRGGGPFDSGESLKTQGFISGLYYEPNGFNQGTAEEQKAKLLKVSDQLRIGLTGNLKDYAFEGATGSVVKGSEVDYNGAPTGYTEAPREAITYIEAHDNQTLFDMLQYKAAESVGTEGRAQMQRLGLSIVALGQGVPFFHAGIDMLRSKSLDRDSYNSGDWFNRLDFSYATNNWGAGLPPEDANGGNWDLMKPLLADATRKPAKADIERTVAHLRAMLQIRKSSKLFRLETGADVMARVKFHNVGETQAPGLIVMSISDEGAGMDDLDPALGGVVVLFNALGQAATFTDDAFASSVLALHPVQLAQVDDPVKDASFLAGTFSIPPRTAAVFVGSLNFP